jgi:hypothetical protein
MSKQPSAGSEEQGVETRTYTEIAAELKSGSPKDTEKPSVEDAKQEEAETTTPPVPTLKPDTNPEEPQTLEEYKAYVAKKQKEWDNAQSKIGELGNEVGTLRKTVAEATAEKDIKPKEKPITELSYVDRFSKDERLKGMTPESKKYLGLMFDELKNDLLSDVDKNPRFKRVDETLSQVENDRIQKQWADEAVAVTKEYKQGQKLMEKHATAIQAEMLKEVQAGRVPSLKAVFKQVAFDDIAKATSEETEDDARDKLNKGAKVQPNRKPPVLGGVTQDLRNLDPKEAFRAMVKEDQKNGKI